MKSEHRHQLQTNALAQRLDIFVNRFRPYASTIAGIIVAIVVVMFLWSYWAGSAAGRRDAAWDEFNQAVSGSSPNLEQLRLASQEHAGTPMQEMADVTWADGQVWMAARDYIYNRSAAIEALGRATTAYEGVLNSSNNDRLKNRAQLGLARVYEIQGDLDQARDAYLKVKGGYEEYAKLQAERLAEPETKDTYSWLATARPPAPKAPMGPGTPGRRPEFFEGELALPGADAASTEGTPAAGDSFEKLLQGLKLDMDAANSAAADPNDRYAPGGTPAGEQPPVTAPDSSGATPEATDGAPATDTAPTEPLTSEPPAADKPAE